MNLGNAKIQPGGADKDVKLEEPAEDVPPEPAENDTEDKAGENAQPTDDAAADDKPADNAEADAAADDAAEPKEDTPPEPAADASAE